MFFKWPTLKSNEGAALVLATLSLSVVAIAGLLTTTDAMTSNSKSRRSIQTQLDFNNFHAFVKDALSADVTCRNILNGANFNPTLATDVIQPVTLRDPATGTTDWIVAFAGSPAAAALIAPAPGSNFPPSRPFLDGVVRNVYLSTIDDVIGMPTVTTVNPTNAALSDRSRLANLTVSIENVGVTTRQSYGTPVFNKSFRLSVTSQRPTASDDAVGPWTITRCTEIGGGNGSPFFTGWTNSATECEVIVSAPDGEVACRPGMYAISVVNSYAGGAVTGLRCCPVRY